MRIGILGASGFLGGALSRFLADKGHDVVGFVFNPSLTREDGISYLSVANLISRSAPDELNFDVVINVAARRSTRSAPLSDEEVRHFTFEIPKDVIKATASEKTLVINASTYIQNFEGESGRTVDSYGAAKEELSSFLQSNSELKSFRTLDLFLFTIFGPGDRPTHLVPSLLQAAKTGEPISLSPGHQLMNLIYVDDVVRNLSNALNFTSHDKYQKHYLWGDSYFSVRELVSTIEKTIQSPIKCEWSSRDYAGHEMHKVWPIPMTQLPNFEERIDLEEGIRMLWNQK